MAHHAETRVDVFELEGGASRGRCGTCAAHAAVSLPHKIYDLLLPPSYIYVYIYHLEVREEVKRRSFNLRGCKGLRGLVRAVNGL